MPVGVRGERDHQAESRHFRQLILSALRETGSCMFKKDSAIAFYNLKKSFIRLPFPTMFSRIVGVLLSYVDRDTRIAWPSQKTLAKQVGCNEKTVKRNLEAARKLGLFMIESVGAEEMKRRVGSKRQLAAHHRFTIYTVDMTNSLWQANDAAIKEAKQVIQQSTHKGVDQRCNRKQSTKGDTEAVLEVGRIA